MAITTGIAWTDATNNFVIGCAPAGLGCDFCFAANLAKRKWGIEFVPGGERRVTQYAFKQPYRWNRMRELGILTTPNGTPVPLWIFAGSLNDFFDKEWPAGVRTRAWNVIRDTKQLHWQIVTKRIGNAAKMLPIDWLDGRPYQHVGIIATVCNQEEYDRDVPKLDALIDRGVRWVGLSVEPQLGPVRINPAHRLSWVIGGGESKQSKLPARMYDLEWGMTLAAQCAGLGIPYFHKQCGDSPWFCGKPVVFRGKGDDPEQWPAALRIQQMPRVYDAVDDTRQLELL